MSLPPLSSLYLYLTEGCNLACRHCWLNPPFDPSGTRRQRLSLACIQQAVEEARPLGLQSLKLTGGEPLLHPQFAEIVEWSAGQGLDLMVETNGLLVDGAVTQALRRHGRVSVSVSLDSARAEVHDAFRGVAGSHARTVDGLRLLAEAGLRPQVIATLIPENRDELADLIRLAESLGAASFKLNIVQPTSRGRTLHQQGRALSIADILATCRHLMEQVAPHTRMAILPDLPHAFRPLSEMHRGSSGRCAVKQILGVLPGGQYALCGIGNNMPDLVFGQVGEDALADIWRYHPVVLAIRRDLPARLQGVCSRCLMKQVCLGTCLAQNYYRGASLHAPFWFCEEAERGGLFPASRLCPQAVEAGCAAGGGE